MLEHEKVFSCIPDQEDAHSWTSESPDSLVHIQAATESACSLGPKRKGFRESGVGWRELSLESRCSRGKVERIDSGSSAHTIISVNTIQGHGHTQNVFEAERSRVAPVSSDMFQLIKNSNAEIANTDPLPEKNTCPYNFICFCDDGSCSSRCAIMYFIVRDSG